jgi:hypothetical protein
MNPLNYDYIHWENIVDGERIRVSVNLLGVTTVKVNDVVKYRKFKLGCKEVVNLHDGIKDIEIILTWILWLKGKATINKGDAVQIRFKGFNFKIWLVSVFWFFLGSSTTIILVIAIIKTIEMAAYLSNHLP